MRNRFAVFEPGCSGINEAGYCEAGRKEEVKNMAGEIGLEEYKRADREVQKERGKKLEVEKEK